MAIMVPSIILQLSTVAFVFASATSSSTYFTLNLHLGCIEVPNEQLIYKITACLNSQQFAIYFAQSLDNNVEGIYERMFTKVSRKVGHLVNAFLGVEWIVFLQIKKRA